ncbi:MAG: EF-hand domain-containing protein [Ectothiorhodospiraceae bacterium]|jgi:hypothetical protein
MKAVKYLMVIALMLPVSAAIAAGGQAKERAYQAMQQLDTNHDGYIEQSEAKTDPALSRDFQKFDANNDMKLDKGEFSRFEAVQGGSPE